MSEVDKVETFSPKKELQSSAEILASMVKNGNANIMENLSNGVDSTTFMKNFIKTSSSPELKKAAGEIFSDIKLEGILSPTLQGNPMWKQTGIFLKNDGNQPQSRLQSICSDQDLKVTMYLGNKEVKEFTQLKIQVFQEHSNIVLNDWTKGFTEQMKVDSDNINKVISSIKIALENKYQTSHVVISKGAIEVSEMESVKKVNSVFKTKSIEDFPTVFQDIEQEDIPWLHQSNEENDIINNLVEKLLQMVNAYVNNYGAEGTMYKSYQDQIIKGVQTNNTNMTKARGRLSSIMLKGCSQKLVQLVNADNNKGYQQPRDVWKSISKYVHQHFIDQGQNICAEIMKKYDILMEEMKNVKLEKPTKIVKIAKFVENVNEINHFMKQGIYGEEINIDEALKTMGVHEDNMKNYIKNPVQVMEGALNEYESNFMSSARRVVEQGSSVTLKALLQTLDMYVSNMNVNNLPNSSPSKRSADGARVGGDEKEKTSTVNVVTSRSKRPKEGNRRNEASITKEQITNLTNAWEKATNGNPSGMNYRQQLPLIQAIIDKGSNRFEVKAIDFCTNCCRIGFRNYECMTCATQKQGDNPSGNSSNASISTKMVNAVVLQLANGTSELLHGVGMDQRNMILGNEVGVKGLKSSNVDVLSRALSTLPSAPAWRSDMVLFDTGCNCIAILRDSHGLNNCMACKDSIISFGNNKVNINYCGDLLNGRAYVIKNSNIQIFGIQIWLIIMTQMEFKPEYVYDSDQIAYHLKVNGQIILTAKIYNDGLVWFDRKTLIDILNNIMVEEVSYLYKNCNYISVFKEKLYDLIDIDDDNDYDNNKNNNKYINSNNGVLDSVNPSKNEQMIMSNSINIYNNDNEKLDDGNNKWNLLLNAMGVVNVGLRSSSGRERVKWNHGGKIEKSRIKDKTIESSKKKNEVPNDLNNNQDKLIIESISPQVVNNQGSNVNNNQQQSTSIDKRANDEQLMNEFNIEAIQRTVNENGLMLDSINNEVTLNVDEEMPDVTEYTVAECKRAAKVKELSRFWLSPGVDSLVNTLKPVNIEVNKTPLESKDVDNVIKIYGKDVLKSVTTIRMDRSQEGEHKVKVHQPEYPGHVLHCDDKPIGSYGGVQVNVLHSVCALTGMQHGVIMYGSPGINEDNYINAIRETIGFYQSFHANKGSVQPCGLVIRTDADTILGGAEIQNRLKLAIENRKIMNDNVPRFLYTATTNYSERKIEACIQQTADALTYVKESIPVVVPVVMEAFMYIGVISIRNLVVRAGATICPYTQFTGIAFDYNRTDLTPMGMPVAIRKENNAKKKKTSGGGFVNSRGIVGFILGLDYNNLMGRRVYKFSSDATKMDSSMANNVQTLRPTISLGMHATLFPLNWKRKNYTGPSRIILRDDAITNYLRDMTENRHRELPNELNMSNAITSSAREVIVGGTNDSIEEDEYNQDFIRCVNAVQAITYTKGIKGNSNVNIALNEDETIVETTERDEISLGLPAKYWSNQAERKCAEEHATALGEMLIQPLVALSSAPMNIKQISKEAESIGKLNEVHQAVQNEIENLENNKVVEYLNYEDIKDKRLILKTFMFCVIKRDSQGNYIKIKCRMVANGSMQMIGSYKRVASPVVSRQLLFLLLHWSCMKGWSRHVVDVTAAFCKIPLDEEIYIELDKAVWGSKPNKRYARLRRVLYGLKQGSREFYLELKKVIIDAGFKILNEDGSELEGFLGFEASQLDGGIFSMANEEGELIAIIACHVDDIMLVANHESIKDQLIEVMTRRFGEVKQEEGTSFCGLSIQDISEGVIKISQTGYLKQIGSNDIVNLEQELIDLKLTENELNKWKECPWSSTESMEFGQDESEVSVKKYQTAIGELLYCVQTRPEINPMLAYLSARQQTPKRDDWMRILRLYVYLRETAELGLIFKTPELQGGQPYLHASCDSSLILKKGYGHTGIAISLGMSGTPFTTISKRQKLITNSSAEAELVGFNMASTLVCWLRNCLKFIFKVKLEKPTIIEGDSMSAIKCIQRESITNNLKHIHPRELYCRMKVHEGEIRFGFVRTEYMITDTLTKLLPKPKLRAFTSRLLGLGDADNARTIQFLREELIEEEIHVGQ